MKIQNEFGNIFIAGEVFTSLSGYVATNCFGVKGMAFRNVQDGLVHLLRPDKISKGVKVFRDEEKINVELHIIVEHGVNIPVLCSSIMSEIRYVLEKLTGAVVGSVNVCVDSILSGD